jgi:hypothetical protein
VIIGYVVIERSKPGGDWDVLDCSFTTELSEARITANSMKSRVFCATCGVPDTDYAVARVEKDEP